jgi:glycosyltransferase involved in cell wall biosynthesis
VLALVGRGHERKDDEYVGALEEHLRRAGIRDRVLIAPLTPNPWQWHAAADVLVCASDNESLPRVIHEAMAFGTPVLSTDVFGIPEVIEDGVTGSLCRSRDENALAAQLDRVLAGRPGQADMCAAAAERVRHHHDADRYAERFGELIQAAVTEPPVDDDLSGAVRAWR